MFGFLCGDLLITLSSFFLFLLAIILSVLLRITASDYPFGVPRHQDICTYVGYSFF